MIREQAAFARVNPDCDTTSAPVFLVAVLKGAGTTRVAFRQISDRTHGSIANNIPKSGDPVRKAIPDFIATTAPSPAR